MSFSQCDEGTDGGALDDALPAPPLLPSSWSRWAAFESLDALGVASVTPDTFGSRNQCHRVAQQFVKNTVQNSAHFSLRFMRPRTVFLLHGLSFVRSKTLKMRGHSPAHFPASLCALLRSRTSHSPPLLSSLHGLLLLLLRPAPSSQRTQAAMRSKCIVILQIIFRPFSPSALLRLPPPHSPPHILLSIPTALVLLLPLPFSLLSLPFAARPLMHSSSVHIENWSRPH